MNLRDFTPIRWVGIIGGAFLVAGLLMLVLPLYDWRSCLLDSPEQSLSLAKLFLVLGTASIAFLAWLKR